MTMSASQQEAARKARERLDGLAKPKGSLGQLEVLGVQLCRAQARFPPETDALKVIIFAGDHGVANPDAEGVSPFPQAVTQSMVQTMVAGKSCVTSLARTCGVTVDVVDVGVKGEYALVHRDESLVRFYRHRVCEGTANLAQESAMSRPEVEAAIKVGRDAVDRVLDEDGTRIFAIGEMGIGNTTPASAITTRLLGLEDPMALVGPGTGLDAGGVRRKAAVVARGLARQASLPEDALEVLRDLGGAEIAAMAGAYLQGPAREVALVVDGFISSAAALVAVKMDARVASHLIIATQSPEPGQRFIIEELRRIAADVVEDASSDAMPDPLLDLGLRLGEGSGAVAALPLLKASAGLLRDVATLDEVLAAASASAEADREAQEK
ncbi:Nicotinate-nucleotide--dimethylbenzimidazole phosphoribosyltransferase [Hondaea fermentalgiana]|uniref:Nicotinate-nucleotide--dimethylbenzimidazole phosphoribosyltransferase n=1 Tax=Hondaea fermentalgiana TaxID=2315210 RepID=A0A2R5GL83_9STRA|nr:Nicotinate-nucleotide--dimethylbenzimidazole phosphoribosyltransferase [Hondaea fermentalgiana]|eukprot:GBG29383.1 Nicotinate-nucleotide--dimethylbenzimidazole phosphoribosyltransferase [Hondaea fermentalgiana]